MVAGLLDTSIIIDLLRNYPNAGEWLLTQSNLAVTRSVYLEVIEGAKNSVEQRRGLALLDSFELVELTISDFDWATRELTRLRLTHNVDAFDCLIAAPSYRLQLPLYTLNTKHFTPLLGKLAQKPY